MLCVYGCRQEAKYTFKNGMKCCSKSWTQCPTVGVRMGLGKTTGSSKMTSETKKEYMRRYRKEQRIEAIAYKGGKCAKCGINGPPCIMEFHHPNNDKDISKTLKNKSANGSKEELDKCDMLCANCHRIAHLADIYSDVS